MVRDVAVVLLLAVAGCDIVWDLEGALPGDGASDEVSVDASLTCQDLPGFNVTMESAPGQTFLLTTSRAGLAGCTTLCDSALPGSTHLFAPTSDAQLTDMIGEVEAAGAADRDLYIGSIQRPLSSSSVSTEWYLITG